MYLFLNGKRTHLLKRSGYNNWQLNEGKRTYGLNCNDLQNYNNLFTDKTESVLNLLTQCDLVTVFDHKPITLFNHTLTESFKTI